MTRTKLAEAHANNFDALRLYAAMVVIYGHGFNMAGLTGPGLFGVPFARVGLDIFFSISGFLVTGSFESSPTLVSFAVKRLLRIWPGLIACSILTAYLLGPLVTASPLGAYLTSRYTFRYLANVFFNIRLYLPGVFLHAHYAGVVNGSLWSLFPEVLCYATVPLYALLPRLPRLVLLPLTGVALGSIGLYMFEGPHPGSMHIYGAELRYLLVTVPFFFVAGACRLILDRNPDFLRGDVALLLLLANHGFSAWFDWWNIPLEWITLPYVVLYFGRASMPVLRRAARFGDLSYGAYLWAFPIQVLLLEAMPHDANSILVCMALSLAAGFLSWHLFEKPAILWGRRTPAIRRLIDGTARPRLPNAAKAILASPPLTVLAAVCLLAAGSWLAYALQIYMGRWQTDEYTLFAIQHRWGWHALLPRLSYSPRPFSEALLYLYGQAVLALHRPLIAWFLVPLWIAAVAVPMLAARSSLPVSSRLRNPVAALLVVGLVSFVLNTGPVTEMFYWPAAAAAYLPTAAAATALVFLLTPPPTAGRQLASGAALLVASASSEMGAAFAISFALASLVDVPFSRRRRSEAGGIAGQLWWIAPGIAGIAVFAVLLTVRIHISELGSYGDTTRGHGGPSLANAVLVLAGELLRFNTSGPLSAPGAALVLRLLFGLGAALLWRVAGGSLAGSRHRRLAAALLGACLFSLFASFFHYGSSCCERQATTRSWFLDLLFVLAASACLALPAARRLGADPRRPVLLGAALLGISLLPILSRLGEFSADARMHHLANVSRKKTWATGLAAGQTMKFFMPPDGNDLLVRGTSIPVGTYPVDPKAPRFVRDIATFFGKTTVIACEPYQTEKSYLLDGRFIPACPPHGGPPDVVYNSPKS